MALGGSNGRTKGLADIERRIMLHAIMINNSVAEGMDPAEASTEHFDFVKDLSGAKLKKLLDFAEVGS